MKYTNCLACKELRESNDDSDLVLATKCRDCDGKGVVRTPESYLCNNCGESLIPLDMEKDCKPSPYGLVEKTVSGGYFSDYLWDCTTYTFSLCEKCLRDLFDQFKIPPQIGGYMGGGAETYEEDSFYHQERLWRKAGGKLEKLKQGLCNDKSFCQNEAKYRIFSSSDLTDHSCCEEHRVNNENCMNYEFVNFELTKDIFSLKEATLEQKNKILNAYFEQNSKPGFITYFKYCPQIIDHIVSSEVSEDYCLLFVKNEIIDDYILSLGMFSLFYLIIESGMVFVINRSESLELSKYKIRDSKDYYDERVQQRSGEQ